MKKTSPNELTAEYHQLQRQLAQLGYLSQGSVFEYISPNQNNAQTVPASGQMKFYRVRQF